MKNLFTALILLALLGAPPSHAAKVQRQGIKTAAECVSAGSTAANCLPLDAQVWVASLSKQLSTAIGDSSLKPGSSTIQRFTSSGTYTTPAGVRWIIVRMLGGGGKGGGGGTNATGTAGQDGTASTFGTSLLTADGGSGASAGSSSATTGGPGGGFTVSSPAINIFSASGSRGGSGGVAVALQSTAVGGDGASSILGGGGPGRWANSGIAANANTGSGGGGGAQDSNAASTFCGGGGGSAGYVEALIPSPSASYSFTIGSGGTTGGAAGTSGYAAGNGADGVISVLEIY